MTASPNPNNIGLYYLRAGTVFFPYTVGKVAGTADTNYWLRAGTIQYPADIQNINIVGNPATVTLANLSVVATSQRTVIGTASVTLANLSVTATSTRTVIGTLRPSLWRACPFTPRRWTP